LIGFSGTTFGHAEELSYLSTDPAMCATGHIMQFQYDSRQRASHHTAATCAYCHVSPHFPGKYLAKAENGWNHSKAFTLQDFPEPIVITKKNADILHDNCLRRHAELIYDQKRVVTLTFLQWTPEQHVLLGGSASALTPCNQNPAQ
jgi:cytochrome c nitrite reductase small subunit